MSKKKKKQNQLKNNTEMSFFQDNAEIFNFINQRNNDKLSEMNGFDLQDLIILIDEYYLQLRNQLGLEKSFSFGIELEFENAMIRKIDGQLMQQFPNGKWHTKPDSTLNNGAEISSPILKDYQETWRNLDKVCTIVKQLASIGKNSGGHIHIGTQALGDKEKVWLNFIKLWSVYENIIFRFVYGEYLTARPSMQNYAGPMANSFWNDYKKLKLHHLDLATIITKISHNQNRRQAVNFNNISIANCNKLLPQNTIEFRCPNGSLDAVIWQNNVNFLAKLLKYCQSESFDDDLIEKRHHLNKNSFSNLIWYNEIYLEQALELCDMIFTNNLDKIYFLKQYLKSFEVCNQSADYPKARRLTK